MCAVPRCGGGADGGGEAMRFSVCVGGGGRPVSGAICVSRNAFELQLARPCQ